MGSIRDVHRSTRRSGGGGYGFASSQGGFNPTQPGDPDFSYGATPDSQAQFPAAAAEQRVHDNSVRAQNILQNAQKFGIDTSGAEYQPVREAAERGLIAENVPIGMKLLGWLDGPRQFINLAIQDIAGSTADEGQRNPHVGDYLNALFGGVEQPELFEHQTGLEPVSGSRTLELFGWQEEDSTGGRIARGGVDFLLQLATDPLTYVTFGLSGLGKKVAMTTSRSLSDNFTTQVLRAVKDGTEDALESSYLRRTAHSLPDLRSDLADRMRRMDPDQQSALRRYINKEYDLEVSTWDDVIGVASEDLDRLALMNKFAEDILQPSLQRNWKKIHEALGDDIGLLPAYMRGGARISFPFLRRTLEHGVQIPGSVGLGRKLVGQPFRDVVQNMRKYKLPNQGLEWLETISDSLDVDKRMMRALGRGDIEPWQYHIAMNAIDGMRNAGERELAKTEINAKSKALFERAAELGYEDQSQVLTYILNRMENVADYGESSLDRVLAAISDPATRTARFAELAGLEDEVTEVADLLSKTMTTYYQKLKSVLPRDVLGDIEQYIPHVLSKESEPIILELARLGATMSRQEILQLQRDGGTGGVLLAQLLNAVGKGGRIEAMVGASRYVASRDIGKTTVASMSMRLTDEGGIYIPKHQLARAVDPAGKLLAGAEIPTSFMPVSELNTEISNAIRSLAHKGTYNFVLPKNWDGKVFSENPLELVSGYIDNMDETARLWTMVNSLQAAGLALSHRVALDVPETVQAMYELVYQNAEKVYREVYPPLVAGTKDDLEVGFDNMIAAITSKGKEADMYSPAVVGVDDFDIIRAKQMIESVTGPIPELDKVRKFALEGRESKALGLLKDVITQQRLRPAPDKDLFFHANWFPSKRKVEEMIELKGAIHFGTQRSAMERATSIKEARTGVVGPNHPTLEPSAIGRAAQKVPKRGKVRTAKIHPKNPFGTPQNPRLDSEQYSKITGNAHLDEMIPVGNNSIMLSDITNIVPEPGGLGSIKIHTEGEVFRIQGDPEHAQEIMEKWEAFKALATDPDMPSADDAVLFGVDDPRAQRAYYDELKAQGYDAVYYRNAVEDEGSISVAVLDASIIEWGDDLALKQKKGFRSALIDKGKVEEGRFPAGTVASHAADFPVTKPVVNNYLSNGMSASDLAGNQRLLGAVNGLPGKPALTLDQFLTLRTNPIKKAKSPIKTILKEYDDVTQGASIPSRLTLEDKPNGHVLKRPMVFGGTHSKAKQNVFARYDGSGDLTVVAKVSYNDAGDISRIEWGSKARGQRSIDEQIALLDHLLIRPNKADLSWANLEKWLNIEMTDDVGKTLYNLIKRKFAGLSDETLHHLTLGEPQEFTRFKVAFETINDMMNDIFTGYGHFYDEKTKKLLPSNSNPNYRLIGDDQFENMLDNVYELAKALDLGTIEKAFAPSARKFTGLAEMKDFVNPNIFALGGPALSSLQVQKDVAVWIRQAVRNSATIYTPEGVAALKLQANESLRWWKAMATVARPTFHIRNFVGGLWNGQIAGVGVRDYAWVGTHGLTIKNAMRTGKIFEEAVNLIPLKDQEVWRAAWEEGVLTSGFTSSEFRKLTAGQRTQRLAYLKAWDTDNFVMTRMGGLFMEGIEDFMRMATFKRWYRQGDRSTAAVARDMVKAVHFDYNNLTPFETAVKSIVPFFVWTRRNLPLQLGAMLENPRMVQRYRAMMSSMDSQFDEEQGEGLPPGDNFSAFAAGTRMYVNGGTPFWARVMIDPDLPIRDVMELPNPFNLPELIEFANGLLGPHVSTLVDMNREREFGDVNAPAPLNLVLKSLAAVGFFDNTTSGDVRIPYWARTVFETTLPFSRDTVEPLLGGPTDPRRQQQTGIAQDDDGLASALKALAFTMARGVGVKLATPQDTRSAAGRSDAELDMILQELRYQGGAAPSTP